MASQSTLSSSSLAELSLAMQPPSFPPPEIQYRGREWIRTDHRENLKKGTPRSKVWAHGDDYIALDDVDQHAWRCRHCSDGNSLIILHGKPASTSPAARHLKKKHEILLHEDEASDAASTTTDGRELPVVSGLIQRVDVEAFRYHLLRWIVTRQVAFIEVEDEDFRQMLLCLSQTIEPYLVQCGDTLRNWLDEEYILAKRQVKQLLSEAKSRIHIIRATAYVTP